ncbi:hypothetical protein ACFWJ5_02490 [Streptomyces qaidamensis]|uniref:hypothetical protein n=1 Tax=Streptomyces qaidamensis TaxID=1783515 RepID=UPI003661B91A
MADVNMHTEPKDLLPLAPRLSGRERAAVYVALGEVSTRAARAVGVDSSTVRRWRQRPDFAADVGRIRLKLLGEGALDASGGLSQGLRGSGADGAREAS